MPISQYLVNTYKMIKYWSMDRFPKNCKTEKLFFDTRNIPKETLGLTYDFLFKSGQAVIFKYKEVFVCC